MARLARARASASARSWPMARSMAAWNSVDRLVGAVELVQRQAPHPVGQAGGLGVDVGSAQEVGRRPAARGSGSPWRWAASSSTSARRPGARMATAGDLTVGPVRTVVASREVSGPAQPTLMLARTRGGTNGTRIGWRRGEARRRPPNRIRRAELGGRGCGSPAATTRSPTSRTRPGRRRRPTPTGAGPAAATASEATTSGDEPRRATRPAIAGFRPLARPSATC